MGRFPLLNRKRLDAENRCFAGSGGVSENAAGFLPAFIDTDDGRVALSRYADGSPAPIHRLDGLPAEWVVERDATGRIAAVKASVVAGFVYRGRFYSREEAAEAASH